MDKSEGVADAEDVRERADAALPWLLERLLRPGAPAAAAAPPAAAPPAAEADEEAVRGAPLDHALGGGPGRGAPLGPTEAEPEAEGGEVAAVSCRFSEWAACEAAAFSERAAARPVWLHSLRLLRRVL